MSEIPNEKEYRLARFLAGNCVELVDLYEKYNRRLFNYCLRLVNDHEKAEDIMQDLWERTIRLCLQGKVFSEDPSGLLWTMARTISLDTLKRDRGHSSIEDLPEEKHPIDGVQEVSQLEELVSSALLRLPSSQREVFTLHTYSGYRFEEIASMLGEPLGAIKNRAWRARINLRKIIGSAEMPGQSGTDFTEDAL